MVVLQAEVLQPDQRRGTGKDDGRDERERWFGRKGISKRGCYAWRGSSSWQGNHRLHRCGIRRLSNHQADRAGVERGDWRRRGKRRDAGND